MPWRVDGSTPNASGTTCRRACSSTFTAQCYMSVVLLSLAAKQLPSVGCGVRGSDNVCIGIFVCYLANVARAITNIPAVDAQTVAAGTKPNRHRSTDFG